MAESKKRIDWPAIRSDWQSTDWSIRRIAEWHQVSDGAIRKKAKQESWPERPQAEPKKPAARSEAVSAPPVIAESDVPDPEQIVARGHGLVFRLLDELDATTTHFGQLADMIETHESDPRSRAAMMKAIELPARANVIKTLATAFKTLNEAKAPEGKKAQRQAAAEDIAAGGRFATRSGPRLAISND